MVGVTIDYRFFFGRFELEEFGNCWKLELDFGRVGLSTSLAATSDVCEVDVLYLLVVVPVLFYCFWGTSHKDLLQILEIIGTVSNGLTMRNTHTKYDSFVRRSIGSWLFCWSKVLVCWISPRLGIHIFVS